jgi:uncharacterized protein (TIGR02118 family)
MINVTVLYPHQEGSRFDTEYYLRKHTPMVAKLLGDKCKGIAVEFGVSGFPPGATAPYTTICQLKFESLEDFQGAFAPHAAEIMADIPNYTSVQPVIQFSEIKM